MGVYGLLWNLAIAQFLKSVLCFQAPQPSGDQLGHSERHSPQWGPASPSHLRPPHHPGVHPAGDGGEDQARLRLLGPLHCVSWTLVFRISEINFCRVTGCSLLYFSTFLTVVCMCALVSRIGGTGGWSSKGCEVLNRNNSHISCQCNHLTSFAVLMDISKREVRP